MLVCGGIRRRCKRQFIPGTNPNLGSAFQRHLLTYTTCFSKQHILLENTSNLRTKEDSLSPSSSTPPSFSESPSTILSKTRNKAFVTDEIASFSSSPGTSSTGEPSCLSSLFPFSSSAFFLRSVSSLSSLPSS